MALIITPEEIASATSTSVLEVDVQNAQDVIEIFTGRDLNTETPLDRFTAADLRRLRLAVQWQSVYQAAHPELFTREVVKRAAANGASVEMAGDGILSPLAARFIKACSWSAGTGDLSVTTLRPSLRYDRCEPDLWTRVG